MEESVEASQDYEFTPSPGDTGDDNGNAPDSPGYVPPSNIAKSKRGRKRKRRDAESEHSDNEDTRDIALRLHEYQWPLYGKERVWFMLQEQVGEYLDIRGMQRRYPDMDRRTVDVEEKKYLIDTEIVTETQGNMGLVALRSDEVLELMEEEFPSKYKEYLETVAERQTQLALEDTLNDNMRLANSEVTRDPSNPDELMQTMIREAVEYNKTCIRMKRDNQSQMMDERNKILFISRPPMIPMPSKVSSRYPVALLPGQYCDNVIRYTPDELRCLPLSTVTSFPSSHSFH